MRFLILNIKNERDESIDELLMFPPLTSEEINKRKDDIYNFLEKPDLLENIKRTLDIRIVGEDSLKLLVFLCATSVFHNYKMSIIVQGHAASGKSYVCRNVLKFFPNVIHFSRMTPAFLDRFMLDLNNYIFYVYELSETQEATGQLRLVLSEGELRLATAESYGGGRVETKILSTKGTPVYITTTIQPLVEEQLGSRCWLASTDPSEEQTKRVVHHIALRHSTPDWEAWREEEILLKYVMNYFPHLKVSHVLGEREFDDIIIPYADELAKAFDMKEERMRRDYERILNLVKTITLLYHRQRNIIELPNMRKYLVSDVEDLKNALKIANPFIISTFLGLQKRAVEIYKIIKEKFGDAEFTTRDVAQLLRMPMRTAREFLRSLYDKGFLYRDESRRTHVYTFSGKEMAGEAAILSLAENPSFFPPEKLENWLKSIGATIRQRQSNTSVYKSYIHEKDSFCSGTIMSKNAQEAQNEALKRKEAQKFGKEENYRKVEEIKGAIFCERCGSYFMTIKDFSEHMKVCLNLKPARLPKQPSLPR